MVATKPDNVIILTGRFYCLLRDVAAGAIVYIAATAALWTLRGRPDGIEREALRRVRRFLAGRNSRSAG